MHDPLHDPFVRLVADRVEREGAVSGGVVADRGQAALRDRKLEAEGAALRDDLGAPAASAPRSTGSGRGRWPSASLRRAAEGGETERDEEDCGKQDEEGDPARPARSARAMAFDPPPPFGARGRHVARHLIELPRILQPVEGQIALDLTDPGVTIDRMPERMPPPAPVTIEVPRWAQLVLLPLTLLLIWAVAGAVRHVLFLFLVALLIALLLNPLVRGLGRARIPRGPAVAFVYLAFAAVVALAILALATVVVQQTRSASHRVDNYFTVDSGHPPQTGAEQDLARFQGWLDRHHLSSVHVEHQGRKFLNQVGTKDVQKYTTRALAWAEGAGVAVVTLLFDALLVVVVSIYMLLDMQRLTDAVDRRFPPRGRGGLIVRMEQAVASYVKGQFLLSLIIGLSVGRRSVDLRDGRPDAATGRSTPPRSARGPRSPS